MKKYSKSIDMKDLGRTIVWRKEIAYDQKKLAKKFLPTVEKINSCPICNNKNSKHYVTVYDFIYDECDACGHIFCATRPDIEKTKNLYTTDSDEKSVQAKIYLNDSLYLKRTQTIAQPKVEFVMEYLSEKRSIDNLKWIDVGSGTGEVLNACLKLGIEAIGVESDPNEAAFAVDKGFKVINKIMDDYNSYEIIKNADIVSAFNVLEHVHEPIKFLKNLIGSNDNQIVVFEVPRHPSLSSFLNQCFPEQACRHIYPPDHLHIFTESSINKMLDQCDLELKSTWNFGQDFYELVTSCASHSKYESKFLLKMLELSNQVQKVIDQSELNDTCLIIAEKKKYV